MLQTAHIGLGPLGARVATDLLTRGLGRPVAAVDPAPSIAGRPLADLLGSGPPDLVIHASIGEIPDWSRVRCAIVATSSDLEACMDTFRELLARGLAVVSTCEELSWPWLRHPVLAAELHELAVRHGGRILGTGVNPGFLMETLPIATTTLCNRVERVRVERIQDAAPRRVPFQRKIGATLTPAQFEERVAEGTLRHVGLGESLHALASHLGMKIERWEETIEPVLANKPLESGLGPIPSGHAAGVRQVARGWVGGEVRLELVFVAAVGQPDPAERIEIEGDPPLRLEIPGGVHGDTATSAVVLNSIRSLLAAPPGLYTMGSLPLAGCAAPDGFASR
ncbi:MAG TPA: dihydrodipicolinate reductase [Planctomycetes bacterium]|nr:dihydrodipicolinate reductase [Planctomycetota bacterium]